MLASPAQRRDLGIAAARLDGHALRRRRSSASTRTWSPSSPGANWSYFPSVTEILVTVGLVVVRGPGLRHRREDVPDHRPASRRRPKGQSDEHAHHHRSHHPHRGASAHRRRGRRRRRAKAWSSGQMFRGIERILQGRDPREAWLFTQRFCGVCTTVHAIASVRAVENALKLEIPPNAQYIRNLIVAAHAMHDHIVHFYQLSALDWVDVVSALKADPAEDRRARREPLGVAGQQPAKQLQAVQGPAGGLRRERAARHLHQRLLGPPGDEARAGGEPARRLALPAGARLPAQGQPGRGDPRRQDAEHPEPRGRRRRQRDQPRQRQRR